MLRRTALAAALLTIAATPLAVLSGGAHGAEEDSYYPSKGNPVIDAGRYNLDLTWKPGTKTLSGTASIRLTAFEPAGSISLDLHRSMDVTKLTVNGAQTPFTHAGKDLVVQAPVVPSTQYLLEVTYAGKPRTVKAPTSRADDDGLGWHTTARGQAWTMQKPYGAFTWYPVNDHLSDKAFYDIRLAVPEKYVGVSNGRLVDRKTVDGQTRTHFTNATPMSPHLVTVAVGRYKRYEQTGPHDLPLTYWLPKGSPELLAPLEKTPDAIAFLESRLGPYPFDRAGVIVTPGLGSAETQTLTTLSRRDYLQGRNDVRAQVVHNLVHAWYGNSVTPNDWRDVWMSEGMATYLGARFAVSRGWDKWRQWKREFARNDDYYREIYGPPGAYFPRQFGQRNVHYGGALLLERLRKKIGTDLFYATMAEWPTQNAGRIRSRAHYIEFLSTRSGQDLRPWFAAWLDGSRTPAA